ncbi:hypothetical protein B0H13DRAFT_1913421 [Mycena leptocephala]|nr:hypothetical protein B0H13DRAFT_1913421 [Mycena leptocephala]
MDGVTLPSLRRSQPASRIQRRRRCWCTGTLTCSPRRKVVGGRPSRSSSRRSGAGEQRRQGAGPWVVGVLHKKEMPVNLVMCIHGMEENGSEGLDALVEREKDAWFNGVDFVYISDNHWVNTRTPALSWGSCISNLRSPAPGVICILAAGWRSEGGGASSSRSLFVRGSAGHGNGDGERRPLAECCAARDGGDDEESEDSHPALRYAGTHAPAPRSTTALMSRMRLPSLSLYGIEGAFAVPGVKTVISAKLDGKFSVRDFSCCVVGEREPLRDGMGGCGETGGDGERWAAALGRRSGRRVGVEDRHGGHVRTCEVWRRPEQRPDETAGEGMGGCQTDASGVSGLRVACGAVWCTLHAVVSRVSCARGGCPTDGCGGSGSWLTDPCQEFDRQTVTLKVRNQGVYSDGTGLSHFKNIQWAIKFEARRTETQEEDTSGSDTEPVVLSPTVGLGVRVSSATGQGEGVSAHRARSSLQRMGPISVSTSGKAGVEEGEGGGGGDGDGDGMGMKVESCGGCDGRRIARRRGEDTEEGTRSPADPRGRRAPRSAEYEYPTSGTLL